MARFLARRFLFAIILIALSSSAALVLAIVNVFVLPFGTALAGYAFWVLLQESGKRVFARAHQDR